MFTDYDFNERLEDQGEPQRSYELDLNLKLGNQLETYLQDCGSNLPKALKRLADYIQTYVNLCEGLALEIEEQALRENNIKATPLTNSVRFEGDLRALDYIVEEKDYLERYIYG